MKTDPIPTSHAWDDAIPNDASPSDVALTYVRRGVRVFPVDHVTKRPLLRRDNNNAGGFHGRTDDLETVTAWWRAMPRAMVGMVPGDLNAVAWDVDSPASQRLADALGLLRLTTFRTITKHGVHVWTRADTLPRGNAVTLDAGGGPLVARLDRGYVVAPGSLRADGFRYTASGRLRDLAPTPDAARQAYLECIARRTAQTAPLPSDLGAPAHAPADLDRRISAYLAAVGDAPEGCRNAQAYKVSAALVRDFALGVGEAEGYLVAWNARHCLPPLGGRELSACLQSAVRHAAHASGRLLMGERAPRATSVTLARTRARQAPTLASLPAREVSL